MRSTAKKRPARQPGGGAEPLRRAELLQISAQLFASKGYSVTTITDIAESANLSKATFYHYFSSKEEVLEEIVIDALTRLNASVAAVINERSSYHEKLRAAVRTHALFFQENFWTFTTMMNGFGSLSPAGRRRAVALRSEYSGVFRSIIGGGIDSGEFAPLDVRSSARGLLSMLFWMSRWFKPSGERPATSFSDEYLDLILFGLLRRDTVKSEPLR